jgi:hypothetical protein
MHFAAARIVISVSADAEDDSDEWDYDEIDDQDSDDEVSDSKLPEVEYGGAIVLHDCDVDLKGPKISRENELEGEIRNPPQKRGKQGGPRGKQMCNKLF